MKRVWWRGPWLLAAVLMVLSCGVASDEQLGGSGGAGGAHGDTEKGGLDVTMADSEEALSVVRGLRERFRLAAAPSADLAPLPGAPQPAAAPSAEPQPLLRAAQAESFERVDGTAEGTEDFVVFETAPTEAAVDYTITLGESVAGLRLVASTLELLDESGSPRLRMAPPYLVDAHGARHATNVDVVGCDVDASPAAPWGRPTTAPGASACSVHIRWDAEAVTYPAVLDPSWTTTGSLATARYHHTASVLADGRVLVAGGYNGAYLASAELYDPSAGTWSTTGSLATARWRPTESVLADGRVLVAGGVGAGVLASAELYDPSAGTCAATVSLATARAEHTASVLADARVLVAGGSGPTTSLASAELYAYLVDGDACTDGSECTSNNCVDGVCCDDVCGEETR